MFVILGKVIAIEDDGTREKDLCSNFDLTTLDRVKQIQLFADSFGIRTLDLNVARFDLGRLSISILDGILEKGIPISTHSLLLGPVLEIETVSVQWKLGEGLVHGEYV